MFRGHRTFVAGLVDHDYAAYMHVCIVDRISLMRGAVLDLRTLLAAYAAGVFPMAEAKDAAEVFWVEPRVRAVLPLDAFHLSRSLRKAVRAGRFQVTRDQAFPDVLRACAERDETWINPTIELAYTRLHAAGHAHSIECWDGDLLAGGLYGVRLGGAFFGESMFSRRTDASKVALAWLVARLRVGRFRLLDCQFMTTHLASLGAVDVSREDYQGLLGEAVSAGLDGPPGERPDYVALDRLLASAAPPAGASSVSGPAEGWVIAQLLGQTS